MKERALHYGAYGGGWDYARTPLVQGATDTPSSAQILSSYKKRERPSLCTRFK